MKRYLTFDDVGLIPRYNSIKSRSDANVKVTIHGVNYDYPFIPANMDTVISKKMAAAVEELSGMIIYHRFCDFSEKLEIITKHKNGEHIRLFFMQTLSFIVTL